MKIVLSIVALFAAVALAVPADPESGVVSPSNTLSKLERRGCGAGCACLDGQCNCDSCYPGGCYWYLDGQSC
jgi:hypothetical protein